jgi:hypothetical protein
MKTRFGKTIAFEDDCGRTMLSRPCGDKRTRAGRDNNLTARHPIYSSEASINRACSFIGAPDGERRALLAYFA